MLLPKKSAKSRITESYVGPTAVKTDSPDEKIEAVRQWPERRQLFSDDEQPALDLTDRMTRDIEVPDELMDRVRGHFDPRGVVELVATVAADNIGVALPDGAEHHPLKAGPPDRAKTI